jgi:LL-diaminopimelate aminotransferase
MTDMVDFDWQSRFAQRIGGTGFGKSTELYKFERIKRAKEAAALSHPGFPLIDLGVGEGDWCADSLVVETLSREAGRAENRRYADNGTTEFREAAAKYMERSFDVPGLDATTEVLPTIGSKSLLAMLSACFIDTDDVLLMPVPAYPVVANWTKFFGGRVHELPLLEENSFLPDLESIPEDVLSRAKMLYLNYPNNPTGAAASPAFFASVVDFAKRHGVVVVHDAAYAALSYDGRKPLSFLSVPGARDVGVEVHSLSKSFNMTGWRMGFLCGNANAVAACAAVKDTTDAGQFRAIQKAAVTALDHPEITARTAEKYSRRFDLLVEALRSLGFDAKRPAGTFYCYTRSPTGTASGRHFTSAADFSDWLLRETNVSTVPWDETGAYLRFSVTFEAADEREEREIMAEFPKRVVALGETFTWD